MEPPLNLSGLLGPVEQDERYQELRAALRRGPVARAVSLEAAKPVVLAALWRDLDAPLLVVVGRAEEARRRREQIAGWTGADAAVHLFPEPDALPYEPVGSDLSTVQARLGVLQALGRRGSANHPDTARPPIVVASVHALLQRTSPPKDLEGATRTLRVGEPVDPVALSRLWTELGYDATPTVRAAGEMSRRGGILDIYPPESELPVRIEFFGDAVESLRLFDPVTQRSVRLIEAMTVGPPRELIAAGNLDGLCAQIGLSACPLEAQARLRRELELVLAGEPTALAERYAGLFPSATLLDYLPSDAVVVLDEPEALAAAAELLESQAAELRDALVERGELPPAFPAPYGGWEDLAAALASRRRLELRFAENPSPSLPGPNPLAPFPEGKGEPEKPLPPPSLQGGGNQGVRSGGDGGLAPTGNEDSGVTLPFSALPAYGGRLRVVLDDLRRLSTDRARTVVVSQQAARLRELLEEQDLPVFALEAVPALPEPGTIALVQGSLEGGWRLAGSAGVTVALSDGEVFGHAKTRRIVRRSARALRAAHEPPLLADLASGDYVVHVEHGIGRFGGLVRRSESGAEREYLLIEYAERDKLYVPTDHLDRVGRYIGAGEAPPALTRLGTQEWARAKERVRRSVQKLAGELIEIYSARQVAEGNAFSPDTIWQQEMEAAFPYVETPDQLEAIRAVKDDMELPRPMDRLICGDVGYGKTEIALRAAFKAIMDGKQVAVLVPTTVLAQQHFNTFRERLAAFPTRIEMLSRFRSEKEQRAVVEGLRDGSVDVCIGTHRLVQKDVQFKDLGLVIVDEEQRFGVAHKERLKRLRKEVDVLTLTATPIPRTLHMALVGIRDLSTMETPPEERLPIKTYLTEYDDRLVREAILRELDRGGQVYFVHNRIQNIEAIAGRLRQLVPEAKLAIGHGQMPEEQLERVMLDFADGEYDILVCTTIIESGLDISRANTIVINEADKFGLAQLYQLRGRVGRSSNRAYAYLLFQKHRVLTETAEKRLRAIFEATELGAGFHIAMKDLEIRGAGSLLGAEQSGHISAVGFDLYCQLLAQAVEELKWKQAADKKALPPPRREGPPAPTIDLDLPALLPVDYVGDPASRIELYRRLAALRTEAEVEEMAQELRDRFGDLPATVKNLLYLVRVKLAATQAGVQSIAAEDGLVVLRMLGGRVLDKAKLQAALGPAVGVGTSQVRLDRRKVGKKWPAMLEALVKAL